MYLHSELTQRARELLGIHYIKVGKEFRRLAGELLCRDKVPTQAICENILFLVMGYDSDQMNAVRLTFFFQINFLRLDHLIKLNAIYCNIIVDIITGYTWSCTGWSSHQSIHTLWSRRSIGTFPAIRFRSSQKSNQI